MRSKKSHTVSRASKRSVAAGSAHKYARQNILGALNEELERRSQVAKNYQPKDLGKFNTIDGNVEDETEKQPEEGNPEEAKEVDVDKVDE